MGVQAVFHELYPASGPYHADKVEGVVSRQWKRLARVVPEPSADPQVLFNHRAITDAGFDAQALRDAFRKACTSGARGDANESIVWEI